MTGTLRLFCFGYGYCARFLADRLRLSGVVIAGTGRSPQRPAGLPELTEYFPFDQDHPVPSASLKEADYILVSIPPDEQGDPVLRQAADLLAQSARVKWIGYLSTTGVYGQRDGGWVDETTPVAPAGPRGARRAAAERAWLDWGARTGAPVHIFRLAGIYGPGRSAIDSLRAGTARRVFRAGQVFNRIHVADIAAVLAASITRPNPGAIYNLADDDPSPPEAPVTFACELMNCDPPPLIPFDQADLSPMARSFWADNKRVCNGRIKRELGVTLRYPSYRDGLRALFRPDG